MSEQSPVVRLLEVRSDDEMPIVLAAFSYFDAFLRQRIFTFQQRYQQLRSGATPAGPLDLSADEILIIIRRMQEQGRGLQAMCLRLGIEPPDDSPDDSDPQPLIFPRNTSDVGSAEPRNFGMIPERTTQPSQDAHGTAREINPSPDRVTLSNSQSNLHTTLTGEQK